MAGDETLSSKPKPPTSARKARVVRINAQERGKFLSWLVQRISTRTWTGSNDPYSEGYTVAEKLSLCAAILLVLGLLTIPIVLYFVEAKTSQSSSDSDDTSFSGLSAGMEDYQQEGSADYGQFVVESSGTHNITCGEGFYVEDGICVPACDEWEQDSHQTTVTISTILLVASLMSLVSGACVIIGSIIRHDSMFRFPSVLIVYITICYCVVEVFNVITHIDSLTGRVIFCSSRNLLHSLDQSTTFCVIAGAVRQYFSTCVTFWWLFHIGWIGYKLKFALFSKVKLNITYIHITLVILDLLLSLPAIIMALTHKNYHYTMLRVPPVSCTSEDSVFTYYSMIFIFNIITMVSITVLLDIIWTVNKHRRKNHSQLRSFIPEIKLLSLFSYFAVINIILFPYHSVTTAKAKLLSASLQEYFSCESTGLPNNCSKSIYTQYTYPQFLVAGNVILSFMPAACLVFVINWRKAKELVLHHLRNLQQICRRWNFPQCPFTATQGNTANRDLTDSTLA